MSNPPDLLKFPTAQAVVHLAAPLVVLGVLRTSTLLVDSWFVGFLGSQALAAIAGATFAMWMLIMLAELAGTGAQTLAAQGVGAGLQDRVRAVGAQALWLAGAVAIGLLCLRPAVGGYFDALGASGPVRALGVDYLDASLVGGVTFCAQAALVGIFRGIGDMRSAMAITALALVGNALLDPLFIFTFGLGMAGAAWATVAANGVAAAVAWAWLARRGYRPGPWRAHAPTLWRLVAIGGPVTIQGVAFSVVYVVLGRVLLPYGDGYLAALGLGHRIESLPYMFCVAFEMAVATLVGQHLGAGDVVAAKRAGHEAARIAALAMIPFGLLLFVGAPRAVAFFTDDPQIIDAGAVYLRFQSTVWWAMAAECVYSGAFAGTGRTLPPLAVSGVLSALRIPLAIGLAATWGPHAVWAAIAATTLLKGAALTAWWRRTQPHPLSNHDTVTS